MGFKSVLGYESRKTLGGNKHKRDCSDCVPETCWHKENSAFCPVYPQYMFADEMKELENEQKSSNL